VLLNAGEGNFMPRLLWHFDSLHPLQPPAIEHRPLALRCEKRSWTRRQPSAWTWRRSAQGWSLEITPARMLTPRASCRSCVAGIPMRCRGWLRSAAELERF